MTAQPQLVQGPNRLWMSKAQLDLAREHGCSKRTLAGAMDGEGQKPICGVPSDPESEMRESAVGGRLGVGGRNPIEGRALVSSVAKPRHQFNSAEMLC